MALDETNAFEALAVSIKDRSTQSYILWKMSVTELLEEQPPSCLRLK